MHKKNGKKVDRDQEDKGLLDEINDMILEVEERGREGTDRPVTDNLPASELSERALEESRGRNRPPLLRHF